MARLLEDPRVRATVNVHDTGGNTALHLARCNNRDETASTSIIHLLLQAGANPAVTNNAGEMPLVSFRKYNPTHHTTIALLEQAPDAEKTSLLVKARLAGAATAATAGNTVVPSCLQARAAGVQPLPAVVLQPAAPLGRATGSRSTRAGEHSKSCNLMAFVLGMEGGPENTGIPRDVFRGVFVDLLMPRWDPLRRKHTGTVPPGVQG